MNARIKVLKVFMCTAMVTVLGSGPSSLQSAAARITIGFDVSASVSQSVFESVSCASIGTGTRAASTYLLEAYQPPRRPSHVQVQLKSLDSLTF